MRPAAHRQERRLHPVGLIYYDDIIYKILQAFPNFYEKGLFFIISSP